MNAKKHFDLDLEKLCIIINSASLDSDLFLSLCLLISSPLSGYIMTHQYVRGYVCVCVSQ